MVYSWQWINYYKCEFNLNIIANLPTQKPVAKNIETMAIILYYNIIIYAFKSIRIKMNLIVFIIKQ